MNYYIGIDLGTSSLKGILIDSNGEIVREEYQSYSVNYPQIGWSEQNPDEWYFAFLNILKNLTRDFENDIKGISFGGQMHGLVILDKEDKVIRPCILWNDGRTDKETEYLNEVIGKKRLSDLTGNIAFAGFTAPKLLWIKKNEPENFARIKKIMLPKDYLAYMLTKVHSSDYSDASGTLLLDVKNKCWSREMCDICDIKMEWLPRLYESYEIIGKVLPDYNLPNAVVTAGAGDNAAAAIGTGTVNNGCANISLGTSGTIFIATDSFSIDDNNALHSFAHANGKWHLMGCILSAASCRSWWLEKILVRNDYKKDDIDAANTNSNNLIFLPYLMGERCPHNDVSAKGAFIGLTSTTTKADMSRAIMEGVAFALRDCLEVAKQNGVNPLYTTLCGGGAKSKVWQQIISDVLNIPVKTILNEQGPALGAAILAMVGNGEYVNVEEACKHIVKYGVNVFPSEINVSKYDKKYQIFKKLYPALKNVFKG